MKAQAIRDAFELLGWDTENKEIIKHLKGTVTSQQVTNERAKHRMSDEALDAFLLMSELEQFKQWRR